MKINIGLFLWKIIGGLIILILLTWLMWNFMVTISETGERMKFHLGTLQKDVWERD